MTTNKLFINTIRGKRRFFALAPVISDISKEEIEGYAIYVRCYSRKGMGNVDFICSEDEISKIKNHHQEVDPIYNPRLYDYVETTVVNTSVTIPNGAYLFTNPQPSLKSSNKLDIFSVADRQLADEVVKDKTVFAYKLQCKNASDYDSLEHRDMVLLDNDHKTDLAARNPDSFLKGLQSAGCARQIEHLNTNKIEYEGE